MTEPPVAWKVPLASFQFPATSCAPFLELKVPPLIVKFPSKSMVLLSVDISNVPEEITKFPLTSRLFPEIVTVLLDELVKFLK